VSSFWLLPIVLKFLIEHRSVRAGLIARLRNHTIPKFEKQPGFYISGWHDRWVCEKIIAT
jgi:hypothetical protein